MLALPLLATTLALTPTGGDSRFELSLGTSIQATPVTTASLSGAPGLYTSGEGHGALTAWSRRIVDDGAPIALQPFLQHAGALHVEGGGGGFSLSPDRGSAISREEGSYGHVSVDGAGYLGRYFWGSLSAGVDYTSTLVNTTLASNGTINTVLTIPLSVAAGVRIRDILVDAGWRVTPTRFNTGLFEVPFWGGAWLHAFAVIRRRVALVAEVDVYDRGAGAFGQAAVYLARRFALTGFVRGHEERTAASGGSTTLDHAGGGLELEAWTTPRLAFAAGYAFDWYRYTGSFGETAQTDYQSVISLTMRLRPR